MIQSISYTPPLHNGLEILYHDEYLIIINKPSGLLSVPGRGIEKSDCLLSRVKIEYPNADIVHRLDMPTSGIIIFSLQTDIQKSLSKLFEQKKINKRYIAKVYGELECNSGIINLPLIADWPNRPKQKVDFMSGKPSKTKYELISTDANFNSLVKLVPVTGRSHQLRVHMAALGNPVLGDALYGNDESREASSRLLLHAENISFIHPASNVEININCPADFQ